MSERLMKALPSMYQRPPPLRSVEVKVYGDDEEGIGWKSPVPSATIALVPRVGEPAKSVA